MKQSFFKSDGNKSRDIKFVSVIVHIFALAHALSCYLFRINEISDAYALSVLTVSMVVIIILFFKVSLDVLVSLLLISSLAGFYLGTHGAVLVQSILSVNILWSHIITTFIVTELLGWLVFIIVRKPNKNEILRSKKNS